MPHQQAISESPVSAKILKKKNYRTNTPLLTPHHWLLTTRGQRVSMDTYTHTHTHLVLSKSAGLLMPQYGICARPTAATVVQSAYPPPIILAIAVLKESFAAKNTAPESSEERER